MFFGERSVQKSDVHELDRHLHQIGRSWLIADGLLAEIDGPVAKKPGNKNGWSLIVKVDGINTKAFIGPSSLRFLGPFTFSGCQDRLFEVIGAVQFDPHAPSTVTFHFGFELDE